MIWITFLPLALYPHHGWMTILSAPLIAFLLLGLENIGIQIEEPFRVLAIKVSNYRILIGACMCTHWNTSALRAASNALDDQPVNYHDP